MLCWQLYDSDIDPKLLDRRLMHQLNIANEWYRSNGMLVNPSKHQAMIIGNTDHVFSFPVQTSITLLGITVDDRRCYNEHVSNICKKITNQFNIIRRFRKLIPATVLLRLYKEFIIPHFLYCSIVWHFWDSRNKDKLKMLNKRILSVILNDSLIIRWPIVTDWRLFPSVTSGYKTCLRVSSNVFILNRIRSISKNCFLWNLLIIRWDVLISLVFLNLLLLLMA